MTKPQLDADEIINLLEALVQNLVTQQQQYIRDTTTLLAIVQEHVARANDTSADTHADWERLLAAMGGRAAADGGGGPAGGYHAGGRRAGRFGSGG